MYRTPGYFFLLLAMALSSMAAESERPGFVEGHITIGPMTPVLRQNAPPPVIPREVYAAWQLTVFKEDGKTEISKVVADDQGNYRVALPPGKYVLDLPHRAVGGAGGFPKTVTIVSEQSVRVDIDIDTGIR